MKIITIFVMSLFLVACAKDPIIIETIKIKEIHFDPSLLDCEDVKNSEIPNPETLTDQKVSGFIVTLTGTLQGCADDIKSIKEEIKLHNDLVREEKLSLDNIDIP